MTTLRIESHRLLAAEAESALAPMFEVDARIADGVESCHLLAHSVADPARTLVVRAFSRRRLRDSGLDRQLAGAFAAWKATAHPGVQPLLAHGESDRLLWCVMPAPNGASLADELAARGPIGAVTATAVLEQVAAALDAAHGAGLFHGGLRASNVIRERDGTVRLGDFGVAAVLDAFADASDQDWTAAGDIVALARLFRAMLVGFSVDAGAADANLSPGLRTLLARAERPDLGPRFASAMEFANAVRGAQRLTPPRGMDTAPQELLFVDPPPRRVLWRLPAFAAAIAIVAIPAQKVLFDDVGTPFAPRVDVTATPPMPIPKPAVTVPDPEPPVVIVSPRVPSRAAPPPRAAPPSRVVRQPPARPAPSRPVESEPAAAPAFSPAPSAPTVTVPPMPESPAVVGVSARPWGHLYLDDRYVGDTPIASLSVAPGRHRIRVVRAGFQAVEREITVRSGERLRITDILLVPEDP